MYFEFKILFLNNLILNILYTFIRSQAGEGDLRDQLNKVRIYSREVPCCHILV